ncbi:MAG: DUF423 domain-containing protein [Myxococcota bacterium]
MNTRTALFVACVLGFLAVALGAFGAHGLEPIFAEGGQKRSEWWNTAAQYHLVHALALGLVSRIVGQHRGAGIAAWCFLLGTLLFSGSLYALALTELRWLGMVTPFGGTLFLVGWGSFAVAALRARSGE